MLTSIRKMDLGIHGKDSSVIAALIASGAIDNSKIADGAAIADTKLDTIQTAGKVANSATSADSASTANAIILRDGNGDFAANTVSLGGDLNVTGTANLAGTLSLAGAADVQGRLTAHGDFVVGDIDNPGLWIDRSGELNWGPTFNDGAGNLDFGPVDVWMYRYDAGSIGVQTWTPDGSGLDTVQMNTSNMQINATHTTVNGGDLGVFKYGVPTDVAITTDGAVQIGGHVVAANDSIEPAINVDATLESAGRFIVVNKPTTASTEAPTEIKGFLVDRGKPSSSTPRDMAGLVWDEAQQKYVAQFVNGTAFINQAPPLTSMTGNNGADGSAIWGWTLAGQTPFSANADTDVYKLLDRASVEGFDPNADDSALTWVSKTSGYWPYVLVRMPTGQTPAFTRIALTNRPGNHDSSQDPFDFQIFGIDGNGFNYVGGVGDYTPWGLGERREYTLDFPGNYNVYAIQFYQGSANGVVNPIALSELEFSIDNAVGGTGLIDFKAKNVEVAGDLIISGQMNLSGATTINGATTISGDGTINGNLHVTGTSHLDGQVTIGAKTTIQGDLDVQGTLTKVNATDLYVNNRVVHVNEPVNPAANDPLPLGLSGLTVDRGSDGSNVRRSHAGMLWNETAQEFQFEMVSEDGATVYSQIDVKMGNLDAHNADFGGTLSVTGDATLSGKLDVTGDLAAGTLAGAEKTPGSITTSYSGTTYLDSKTSLHAATVELDAKLALEVSRATAGEAQALADAQTYADAAVLVEKNRAEAAEAQALLDAKAYADAAVLVEKNRAEAGEAQALADAKSYADAQIAALVNGAPAALDTLKEIADQLASDESAAAALTTALSNEVTRAQTAESDLQSQINTLSSRQIYSAFIDGAVGGETSLAKPAGAPAIPDSENAELYIDGRKVRRSSGGVDRVFSVAVDGSEVTFAALFEGQDVELRYWA